MSIILASASPRRKELLEMLGVKDMRIIPAKGEETAPENVSPGELVEALALQKAREVCALCSDEDVVIAADTIVWHENRVYGKPHSRDEAAQMLRSLSGAWHQVYTGIAVIRHRRESTGHEMSAVCFRPLSEGEIERYIDTGEPMDKAAVPIWQQERKYYWQDKAGGYGIQDPFGMKAVKRIEGDYYNIVGLPVSLLCQMLKEFGIDI